jgi:hypothetical protein
MAHRKGDKLELVHWKYSPDVAGYVTDSISSCMIGLELLEELWIPPPPASLSSALSAWNFGSLNLLQNTYCICIFAPLGMGLYVCYKSWNFTNELPFFKLYV